VVEVVVTSHPCSRVCPKAKEVVHNINTTDAGRCLQQLPTELHMWGQGGGERRGGEKQTMPQTPNVVHWKQATLQKGPELVCVRVTGREGEGRGKGNINRVANLHAVLRRVDQCHCEAAGARCHSVPSPQPLSGGQAEEDHAKGGGATLLSPTRRACARGGDVGALRRVCVRGVGALRRGYAQWYGRGTRLQAGTNQCRRTNICTVVQEQCNVAKNIPSDRSLQR
jgi:hypothetical protein